jgi:hypothetical protein
MFARVNFQKKTTYQFWVIHHQFLLFGFLIVGLLVFSIHRIQESSIPRWNFLFVFVDSMEFFNKFYAYLKVSQTNLMCKSDACILSTYCILQTILKRPSNFKLCMKRPFRFSNSEFWVGNFVLWPRIIKQKCNQIYSTVKFVDQNFHFPILSRNLYGRYL